MDCLVQYVFAAGIRVIDRCEEAKQCEIEVVRIAIRTQNVLGTLRDARNHFDQANQGLDSSLLELKEVFEQVNALVGRCGVPVSLAKKASLMWQRGNPNKQALINAEKRLEQITTDLGLPMLTDIKQQLNRMHEDALKAHADSAGSVDAIAEVVRNEIQRAMSVRGQNGNTIAATIDQEVARLGADDDDRVPAKSATEPASSQRSSYKAGGLMVRLGRVKFADLEEGEVLGEGTFGTVLSGRYRGRDVAVKKARGAIGSSSITEAFRQEAEIHYAMRHSNIVEVIAFGLGDDANPPCLVMERMHETLYDLLGVDGIEMPLIAKVSIVRDICEGMGFLHSHGIMHRDLKSLNVLLDEASTVAKISDFGLAKVNTTIATSTGGGYHSKVGSDFWMAPEVHSHHKATRAADVFSLHVVMWEAIAQERAGGGKPIGERLLSNPNARLPLVDMDCSEAVESNVKSIVWRCGSVEKSDRPPMHEVCKLVTEVLRHLENPDERPLSVVAPPPLRSDEQQQTPAPEAAAVGAGVSKKKPGEGGTSQDPYATAATELVSNCSISSVNSRAPPLPPRRPVKPSESMWKKKDDRGVLISLLQKCSPPPVAGTNSSRGGWEISTGWAASGLMSRWYGVATKLEDTTVFGSERVTSLALVKNGLCGDLPEEINALDWLVLLDLKDNRLTGTLLPSIKNLRFLQTLDLSGNKLIGNVPPELGELEALTSINLHHTCLYGEIPETLGNLAHLDTLDISDSDLWGPIPKSLGKLKALRVLRLGSNRLNGEIPDAFAELEMLEELHLGANELTGAIEIVSGAWPRLRILDLSANRLEGWIPPELFELERLTILRLYRNFGISGGIPPWLGSMKSLEEIDLSATQLGGLIPKELGDLGRLTTLTLGSCQLEGVIPPELGRLRHLKHLALFDNNLTGPIPPLLLQLPVLRSLNLERNKLSVTRAMIGGTQSQIKKILPKGCNIRL